MPCRFPKVFMVSDRYLKCRNIPSSPKLISALRRYVAYRGEHDMGTAFGRTEYHGPNPHLPLVLSRKGYPYALSLKRLGTSRVSGPTIGRQTPYRHMSLVCTGRQARMERATADAGHSLQDCSEMAQPSSRSSYFSGTRTLTRRADILTFPLRTHRERLLKSYETRCFIVPDSRIKAKRRYIHSGQHAL
ncbi:integrase family protein [Caballeronia udeis]|uniref:Integrase family protein n=1 Tax=Caballeronia udeis TaxID=1232866 RepID=A0A158JYT5_9BURK|nr:integrase family protein [Caballeronia udeis]